MVFYGEGRGMSPSMRSHGINRGMLRRGSQWIYRAPLLYEAGASSRPLFDFDFWQTVTPTDLAYGPIVQL